MMGQMVMWLSHNLFEKMLSNHHEEHEDTRR